MKSHVIQSMPVITRVALIAILVGVCSESCRASVTVYTSLAGFQAATSGLSTTTETFDAYSDSLNNLQGSSVTLQGVNFASTSNSIYIPGPTYAGGFFNFGTNNLLLNDNTAQPLVITLPAGTTAVGASWGDSQGSASMPFSVNGTPVTTLTWPGGRSLSFLGFVSDSPISTISVTSTNSHVVVDNFAFAAPEPGRTTLLGAGAMTILARRRRASGIR